jgi:glycosyltransferase 2 family protein
MRQRTGPNDGLSKRDQDAVNALDPWRIWVPTLMGLTAVSWLLWRKFNPADFSLIRWNAAAFGGIAVAIGLLAIRHLAYAARLRILSEGAFSWRKCIELMFIWEFGAAVSPSSVGGSAIAFFVLAQEKVPVGRSSAIVLYTIVLDSLFFVITVPLLLVMFGAEAIRPEAHNLARPNAWVYSFLIAYSSVAAYCLLFAYGLLVRPRAIRKVLACFTRRGPLRKYHPKALRLGVEMERASYEIKRRPFKVHFSLFLITVVVWTFRFLLLSVIITGFLFPELWNDWATQAGLYARMQCMYIIMALSPTPGGSGIIEIIFGGFIKDYSPTETFSTVLVFIWRLISYYTFLLAGVIILPGWLRKVWLQKRKAKIKGGNHM